MITQRKHLLTFRGKMVRLRYVTKTNSSVDQHGIITGVTASKLLFKANNSNSEFIISFKNIKEIEEVK